jgi:hypothetical protein
METTLPTEKESGKQSLRNVGAFELISYFIINVMLYLTNQS